MRNIVWLMCLLVAACGGSGNGGSTGGNIAGNNSPPPDSTSCNAADNTAFSGRVEFPILEEIEPNDEVAAANVLAIPTPAPAGNRVGLLIKGTVHDVADRTDTFSFGSSRSKTFFLKLCESTCNTASGNDRFGSPDSLDVSIAYFSVLDGTGNVLLTTETNKTTENYLRLCVYGGVITYIKVAAKDTMNEIQNYAISAMETL